MEIILDLRRYWKPSCVIALLLIITATSLRAQKIVEVLPLTNKIIMVHVDDGSVTYPNTLSVTRLNVVNAGNTVNWAISSSNDADYTTAVNPTSLGRKSKGTEFLKDAPWGGSSFSPTSKPWASEHWIYLVLEKPLKTGKQYSLNTGSLAANGSQWDFVFDEKVLRSEAVHVNTIGYETNAPKYGYIYQWMGNLGGLNLTDYAGKTFWVMKAGEVVKQGTIQKRKVANNAETSQTNDTPNRNFLGGEVYDCDFSDVTAQGVYTLAVEGIGSSYPFKIGADAVWEAYYHVARGLYHQRSGIRLAPPYTAEGYIRPVNQNTQVTSDNGTSFAGKLLYSDYSYMDWAEGDGGGSSVAAIRAAAEGKPLDVAGWYHDAGDWDSYWTHHRIPILLMLTWEYAPTRFGDDELNIPESGNGIPDLIDEASWLIKFNYRLRKELKLKNYSDGGVGGARVCSDVYTDVDKDPNGKAWEGYYPSWQEGRRAVVTKADAFMTYLYAGQASQFACVLKKVGKDPARFPVEMLDHVDFASMTVDTVNWIAEAEEAYQWASAPENQPSKSTNYSAPLRTYKMYAATNLFRLTGKAQYHTDALTELNKLKAVSSLSEDERWGVYAYLLSDNYSSNKSLQADLKKVAINIAENQGVTSSEARACRWGGSFGFPMLVGQATTPAIFETLIASCITGDQTYEDVVHTTADYFLGTNPLHSSWMTGVGPRPASAGFHLDTRYNNNWVNYPGFIPYGPWSMAYGFDPYTWTVDGVSIQGGHGPWNKDWANFSMSPQMANWPGHERWNGNIHAPMSTENTIHQNTVFGAITYGFVNNRHYANSTAAVKLGSLSLDRDSLLLTAKGTEAILVATTDISNATFPLLKWSSSDPRIAYVDDFGTVTGVNAGICTITCSTEDGGVVAVCEVTCQWAETEVTGIQFNPLAFTLYKGQNQTLEVAFTPADATNQYVDFTASPEGIVEVDENGILTALAKGVTTVTGTSLSGGKLATCEVTVKELVDYVVADFDAVIPVTTEPQDSISQLFTPEGTNDIAFNNPLVGDANPSEKVVKWGRPAGDWRLIGMVLPLKEPQDMSEFSQFQFKYYGKGVKDILVQLIGKNGQSEINQSVEGYDCWRLFSYDLSSVDSLIQFNIFVNKTGSPGAITCYFDDFKLAGPPAIRFDGTTISHDAIELDVEASFQLTADTQGNPFTWVSSDESIATVDQVGLVTAVGGGITAIQAVPLFGEPVECIVKVTDPGNLGYDEEVFLDFETIELDWSGGYGAYAWDSNVQSKSDNPSVSAVNPSSKVYKWERDIVSGNKWGGYSILLPTKSTSGWERISAQFYADKPVTTIRMELATGETVEGELVLTGLTIPAFTWTEVEFDLVTMAAANKSFDKITCQVAGGSDVAKVSTYSDNFRFEKGVSTSVPPSAIGQAGALLFPNPAKDLVNVLCPKGIKHLQVLNMTGRMVMAFELDGSTEWVLPAFPKIETMYIVKITDVVQNVYLLKLMVE